MLNLILNTWLRVKPLSTATVATVVCAVFVTACGKASEVRTVGVHAVNYSGEDFSYWIEDAADSWNAVGGEIVRPFAAGGTLCCYKLPRKWRPGIAIKVTTRIYSEDGRPQAETGSDKTMLLTLSPYANGGKAGDLWLVRHSNGALDILSSNVQPNHKEWPGKIKGWPAPSAAYQRERLTMHIQDAEIDAKSAQESLKELNKDKFGFARREWDRMREYFPDEIRRFSGPLDEEFISYLRRTNEADLAQAQLKIERLKEAQP
jgi:Protein of unknown function (DUF3304)